MPPTFSAATYFNLDIVPGILLVPHTCHDPALKLHELLHLVLVGDIPKVLADLVTASIVLESKQTALA